MTPGPISDSYKGPREDSPYVPSFHYRKGANMCPCGHHEGYHADDGKCLLAYKCGCEGLPESCRTPIEDM